MANPKLDMFLRAINSGGGTMTPEMYAHFGGDGLIEALKQYDPNASVIDEEIGGGEGGSQGMGKRLNFDVTKLPKSKAGDFYQIRPNNWKLAPGVPKDRVTVHDENYGDVVNGKYIDHRADGFLEKYAPYIAAAIAMGGPALAGLAAAGLAGGVGVAAGAGEGLAGGLTSGVTGSGLTGINAMELPDWLIQGLSKAPQTAGQVSSGHFDPLKFGAGMAGSAFGVNPMLMQSGMTLANLARQGR